MNCGDNSKILSEKKIGIPNSLFSNYPFLFFLMNTNKDNLLKLINSSTETKKEKNKISIKSSTKELLLTLKTKITYFQMTIY